MPAGIDNPVLGLVTFGAIKFAGYSLAARVIARKCDSTEHSPYAVGATRLAIGCILGPLYAFTIAMHVGELFPLIGLFPVRMFEWWLIVWWFYDDEVRGRFRWQVICLASVWSYVLNIPAIIGFIATAGVWIC